ncbi:hypothetical protein SLEP1_g56629 [Rubroshorea leprosula]|uniref:Disease resistance protein RGA3 n=1 Tax=Rubroshorea leprosula TaxID=152421 RepID=A0AAV5MK36_9ROSI|nr:hypothetical protein SLEP1_g56629 [Rubroshorea leprosula]
MGEFILVSVVEAALSKVIAFASDLLNLALGGDEDLLEFRHTMRTLRGFLQDADEKNVGDVSGHPDLKSWLQNLRDIADEADDILEEVAYEGMRPEVKKSKAFDLCALLFRRKMANRVEDLNKRLADINSSAHQLGLQHKLANVLPEPRGRAGRETHSFLSSQVFGREEDVSKMVSLLVDSSSQHDLPVMIIVGMAGLGKTTIAKAVLKNEKIREHFGDNKMWVCVSENFDVKKILMEMLKSCSGSSSGDGDFGSKDIVMKKIQEKLGEKNYLLILDDVWNEERQMWEDLRDCLLGISEKKGSRWKVLVTTRLENVASLMALTDEHIHRPCLLKDDECWSIIKQRAFGNNSVPEAVERIGIQIARRCKGVPLAARIIGGMPLNEWQAIIENSVWDSSEKEKGILDIIKFSYDRLPTLALKQCFAFCSIFPKDFVMEREMLIQLWMAQGFLESSEESYMAAEDIGDKYFRYLLSYSLFQEERRDNVTGSVKSCKMHDLIHDFAQSISKFETLIVEKWLGSNISHDVRHLNLIDGREMVPTILEDVAKKLQTLFSKHVFSSGVQVDLKRLRVLSLDDASDAKQLPTCFGNSKRLRYLDISRTQMKELPEFISELYNLQTFRFTNCKSLQIPPGGIGDLINLRHIYFNDEERMPANLGRLTNLQTLPLFFVSTTKGRKIEELGSLRGLKGGLQIRKLDLVEGKSEAEKAKLHEKAVDVLQLCWRKEGNRDILDEDVLEGLQPHSNIRRLIIEGYGGRNLASWMLKSSKELLSLNNLVELRIGNCGMLYRIPGINGFSSLQKLSVICCNELTSLGDGDGAVLTSSSLKELHIYQCGKLKSCPVSGLSSLERLYIKCCDEMTSLGDSDGALTLISLKNLSITGCNKLERFLVSGLSSLKALQIWNCKVISSIGDSLSSSTCLKQLCLRRCPELKFVPSLEGLVSLKIVEVDDCDGLEYLPRGLSSCIALEELKILNCSNLVSIPEELKQLRSLVKLDIQKCPKLKFFPSLEGLVSLKTVKVGDCDGLECLPSGLSSCTVLEELEIWKYSNLVSIPEEVKQLRSLVKLDICECPKLKFVPSLEGLVSLKTVKVGDCDGLECLPSELLSCTALEELRIWNWCNLVSIPEELKQLQSLLVLDICECPKLKFVPSLEGLVSLKTVVVEDCDGLECLPSGLSSCTALEELRIWNCCNLVSIPEELKQLQSLLVLDIWECRKLRSFPEEILSSLASLKTLRLGHLSEELEEFPNLSSTSTSTPTSLEDLCLGGWGNVTLPHQIQRLITLRDLTIESFNGVEEALSGNLSFLKTLTIKGCNGLRRLSSGLLSLERLSYENCPNLVSFHRELKELHSLTILGCPKLVGLLKESLGCCTRLKRLEIGRFSEELEEFPSLSSVHASLEGLILWGWKKCTHLPQIQHLTALKWLNIDNFSGMESLPDWFNNLSSLRGLYIWYCPNKLKERCTEGSGPDWHKISHIPYIVIDGKIIQSKH